MSEKKKKNKKRERERERNNAVFLSANWRARNVNHWQLGFEIAIRSTLWNKPIEIFIINYP